MRGAPFLHLFPVFELRKVFIKERSAFRIRGIFGIRHMRKQKIKKKRLRFISLPF